MKHWWQDKVIYQIYPKSFKDTNGDGIGDLQGIISKLDYLKYLGIGAIWLSPIFSSPQADNGYDVSDFYNIDPMFGTMDDFDKLIIEANKRNIKILVDLVLNHTSDEHPWFLEAKKSKDNPYHDFYVWRDGDGITPPTQLRASFGGSAWQYVPEIGQYYLHQYAIQQPDLNWDNPNVRAEIHKIVNFWINKGVGGFRFDVIDMVAKEPDINVTANGKNLHKYLQEMVSVCKFKELDLLTVGETFSATTETAKIFSNPDGSEFSMIFNFEHFLLDRQEGMEKWDLRPLNLLELKKVIGNWQTELFEKGWNSLYLENHDSARIVSRWGNDQQFRIESSKMLATFYQLLSGTPYVYQGQELGMTNPEWYDINLFNDLDTINMYNERLAKGYPESEIFKSIHAKSRDNARTPFQWSSEKYAGFSTRKPWLDLNDNYTEVNLANQIGDKNSILNYYKDLISLRSKYSVLVYGNYKDLLPQDADIVAYERKYKDEHLVVICNFTSQTIKRDLQNLYADYELIINSYGDNIFENKVIPEESNSDPKETILRPYESRVYYKKREKNEMME